MIHVIGASGFIGKAIIRASKNRTDFRFYSSNTDFLTDNDYSFFSITDKNTWKNIDIAEEDKIIFLPWRNLPNYQKTFHINKNLVDSLRFFEYLIDKPFLKIVIAGTCYEYGLQNGELSEELPTKPVSCYAVAKDSLRSLSESLFSSVGIDLAWLRIFYPYGEGQNQNSLIPSLERALLRGDDLFNTSQGDQIRDFIHVNEVAKIFIKAADSKSAKGIINVGTGNPISIRDFLESYIKAKDSHLKLNLGFYPRRTDEPLAFWSDSAKLKSFYDCK